MKYKEKGYISVVCYLQNDSKTIEAFIREVSAFLLESFESLQFVFVDDFSSDNTFDITSKLMEDMKLSGSILRLSQKHGRERGVLAGLDKAVGDFIFDFDSPIIDFPLSLCTQSFEKIKSGKDIVVVHPKDPVDLFTQIYYYLFNKFSYLSEPIATERMQVMTRRALNSILTINERVRNKKALLSLAGFPRERIPYTPINKKYVDKRPFSEKLSYALESLISYTFIGSRAPMLFSVIFFIISILIGVWATYNYLYTPNVAGIGWASTMGFLSISFSGLFFILAILSEFLIKILRESVNIPIYTISQTFTSSHSNL